MNDYRLKRTKSHYVNLNKGEFEVLAVNSDMLVVRVLNPVKAGVTRRMKKTLFRNSIGTGYIEKTRNKVVKIAINMSELRGEI